MNRVFFRKYLPEILGTLLGAAGGFIYWKYVGCLTGTCAIKSNWYFMVPLAAVPGFLAGSITSDFIRRKKEPEATEKDGPGSADAGQVG